MWPSLPQFQQELADDVDARRSRHFRSDELLTWLIDGSDDEPAVSAASDDARSIVKASWTISSRVLVMGS
jgi:hypothetical protein